MFRNFPKFRLPRQDAKETAAASPALGCSLAITAAPFSCFGCAFGCPSPCGGKDASCFGAAAAASAIAALLSSLLSLATDCGTGSVVVYAGASNLGVAAATCAVSFPKGSGSSSSSSGEGSVSSDSSASKQLSAAPACDWIARVRGREASRSAPSHRRIAARGLVMKSSRCDEFAAASRMASSVQIGCWSAASSASVKGVMNSS
mmetsp:Transcript_15910/g.60622  ORF Transcript_15910/g.60622 Transcript_15910/m.60622 type:complete len:204 (-) Transcript_15910:839-1450(-)|eukprot:scaffold7075_cov274-Pinguiococcus_pyrenoidosus.AAC.6